MSTPARNPAKRADATRNRDKILAAARSAFADEQRGGGAVSMAEVARRAGVGMATLYRNFPGRRELLEALYISEVEAVVAAADDRPGDPPGDRFESWVQHFLAFSRAKHDVATELMRDTDDRTFFSEHKERVLAAGSELLAAAQAAGEIRADLNLAQILEMVMAIAAIKGEPAHVQPILNAAVEGLRVRG